MKPIELELRWFGQYTDTPPQVVRFDQLEKVFLITGETGAGKTTLFDAMAYALYGMGLGARSSAAQLRSQLAGQEHSTVVRFVFEVGGTRWEVERSPYNFVRKKRTGAPEIDKYVRLTRLTGPGAPEAIPPDAIGERLSRLLVLRFQDFSKILVLPQGEFQQFLAMKSGERATLLKTLFPVGQHEQIARLAKEDVQEVREKIDENEKRTKEVMRDFDPAGFAAQDAAHDARLAELRQAEVERVAEQKAAESALHEARTLANQIAMKESRVDELRAHELGREEQKDREARVDAARRAAGALPAVDHEAAAREEIARLETQLGTAREAEAEAIRKRDALQEEQQALPKREADLQAATLATDRLRARLVELQALAKARAEEERLRRVAEEVAGRAKAASARVTEAEAALGKLDMIAEERDAAFAELHAAREAVSACHHLEGPARLRDAWNTVRGPELEGRVQDARRRLAELARDQEEAEAALARARARVEADTALLLAATLKPGEDCPVCGGTDHPKPRTGQAGAGDALALQREAEAGARRAQEAHAKQGEQVAKEEAGRDAEHRAAELAQATLAAAGHATPQAWKAAWDAAQAALAPLEEADTRRGQALAARPACTKELAEARAAAERAAQEARTASDAHVNAGGHVAGYVARLGDVSDVSDVSAALAATRQAVDDADRANRAEEEAIQGVKRRWAEAMQAAIGAESTRTTLAGQLARKSDELPAISRAAADALREAAFPTVAEVRAAAMIPRELEALHKCVADWQQMHFEIAAKIQELERGIAGRPNPDLPAREEAVHLAAAAANAAAEERRTVETLQADLRRKNTRLLELRDERDRLLANSRGLLILSKHLNGEVAPKIDFATWMLTWWLERVLVHANGQLRALSDGRYLFRLRTEQRDGRSVAGLDVEVLDTWSNQLRDVNALSGGEKFLASLSLALGLADVVQSLNGGVRLDTLFIDEGFGSLDAETLNRAMDLIDQISQHRAVGLISHVEAMQKSIFSQVRVAKSPAGSTVTVVNGGVE